ncbi:sigma-70 family RNA polymerase sigma factor [bacterium]|nr:sigma-70 family RNA polymerase sigma factor [bacterium]
MNEELVLKFISPYVNSGNELTYDEFDNVFSILDKKEQYKIMEFLEKQGILFVDEKGLDSGDIKKDDRKTFVVTKESASNKNEQKIKQVSTPIKDSQKIINKSLLNETNESLIYKYQATKNENILKILIEKNKKYIFKIANKISHIYVNDYDEDDIFQIACLGFVKGCKRYDNNCGYKLLTYVTFWIKQHLIRDLINTGTSVRVPVHMWDKILKVRRLLSQYPELSHEELAEKAELPVDKFEYIIELMRNYLTLEYLDRTINDNESMTVLDSISDKKTNNTTADCEAKIEKKLLVEKMGQIIEKLSPRERDIIILRFGLMDNRQRTLEEIGHLFGVTRERIRQVEAKALRKLRNPKLKRSFEEFFSNSIEFDEEHDKYMSYFKKNEVSYMPTVKEIIDVVSKNNPEMNRDELYEECVECAIQTGYGEFESMNYFLDNLK